MLNIRPATRADAPVIASLVRELADYEKLLDEAKATPQDSCASSNHRTRSSTC